MRFTVWTDLHVDWAGNNKGHQGVGEAHLPSRQTTEHRQVIRPKERDAR